MRTDLIGILGDGQLARMLVQAAGKLKLSVVTLANGMEDPATLREFLRDIDVAIFENEFVDCKALANAAQGLAVRFVPDLSIIEQLQQKLGQKALLNRLSIPTSEHVEYGNSIPKDKWLVEVENSFGLPFVLKWSLLGYDGKGVLVVNDPKTEMHAMDDFLTQARARGVRIFAERFIPFKRELAIVAVHSKSSGFTSYPLVISEQKRGICHRVSGPAVVLGVALRLEELAKEYAEKLAEELSIEGAFAIEFFEMESGELLVNEIAPRVHNTGHYSIDASETCQFENHLRAVVGRTLGSTQSKGVFAMLNLLGPPGISVRVKGSAVLPSLLGRDPSFCCHWYDKDEIRPNRKLGHLNGVVSSTTELPKLLKEMDVWQQEWVERIRNEKTAE